MFLNHYYHSVDRKGRIVIPSEFREKLQETVFLTPGIENCIFLYTESEWKRFYQRVASLSLTRKEARDFMRLFLSSAASAEIDPQGRVMLPTHLRNYAQIDKKVVLAGVGNRIEIWSEENWNNYMKNLEGKFEAIAESIEMIEPIHGD